MRAAQWGWNQAHAAMAQRPADTWPTPITDRPPTEADGDDRGKVQVLWEGAWELWRLSAYISSGYTPPWFHTPRWRPPAPSVREQAIKALRERIDSPATGTTNREVMQQALRALEGGE